LSSFPHSFFLSFSPSCTFITASSSFTPPPFFHRPADGVASLQACIHTHALYIYIYTCIYIYIRQTCMIICVLSFHFPKALLKSVLQEVIVCLLFTCPPLPNTCSPGSGWRKLMSNFSPTLLLSHMYTRRPSSFILSDPRTEQLHPIASTSLPPFSSLPPPPSADQF
jgi:hypothetical protein